MLYKLKENPDLYSNTDEFKEQSPFFHKLVEFLDNIANEKKIAPSFLNWLADSINNMTSSKISLSKNLKAKIKGGISAPVVRK